jgi:hypothetical protein
MAWCSVKKKAQGQLYLYHSITRKIKETIRITSRTLEVPYATLAVGGLSC